MSDYTWWQNALSGNLGPIHEGLPQPGFYKRRVSRGGLFVPVAIWEHEGELMALEKFIVADAADIWLWCAKHPIRESEYRYYEVHGNWETDVDIAPRIPEMGDNNPPDEYQILKGEIERLSEEAGIWLGEVESIKDQTAADKAANFRDILGKLHKRAEKQRKDEKEPHLEAGKAIDAKYKAVQSIAEAAGKEVGQALTAYMVEQEHIARAAAEAERKRLAEEQRQREEEARKAAEEAKAQGEPEPVVEIITEPAPLVIPEKVKAGGTFSKSTTLRSYWSAGITDYAKALQHYATNQKVYDLIQQLADADARLMKQTMDIPGVKAIEDRRAV